MTHLKTQRYTHDGHIAEGMLADRFISELCGCVLMLGAKLPELEEFACHFHPCSPAHARVDSLLRQNVPKVGEDPRGRDGRLGRVLSEAVRACDARASTERAGWA